MYPSPDRDALASSANQACYDDLSNDGGGIIDLEQDNGIATTPFQDPDPMVSTSATQFEGYTLRPSFMDYMLPAQDATADSTETATVLTAANEQVALHAPTMDLRPIPHAEHSPSINAISVPMTPPELLSPLITETDLRLIFSFWMFQSPPRAQEWQNYDLAESLLFGPTPPSGYPHLHLRCKQRRSWIWQCFWSQIKWFLWQKGYKSFKTLEEGRVLVAEYVVGVPHEKIPDWMLFYSQGCLRAMEIRQEPPRLLESGSWRATRTAYAQWRW